MTRPSAETNEPDPPLLKRTDDFMRCSSHGSLRSKPYFVLSCSRGGAEYSHMPSSARVEVGNIAATPTNAARASVERRRSFIDRKKKRRLCRNASRKRRTQIGGGRGFRYVVR